MRYIAIIIVFVCLSAILVSPAHSQGPPIITDTPILLGLEGRAVMARSIISRSTTLYRNGEEIVDPMRREVTAAMFPIAIPYNVTRNFLVGVTASVVSIKSQSIEGSQSSTGLGDIFISAKYLLIQRDRVQETFRVAGKAGLKLPSGDEASQPALGTGTYDVSAGAVAGWIGRRFGVYGDVVYTFNGTADGVSHGDTFQYNLAIGFLF